jgi:hypothetical protein
MSNQQPTKPLATAKQVGMIKGLMAKLGLLENSIAYALQYSDQRTEHIGQLTMPEANLLIKNLMPVAKNGQTNEHIARAEACNTMRRKIISMGREMGWHTTDHRTGKLKANMERVENWCQEYGYLHKGLNAYTFEELPKLVTQMEFALADFRSKL